MSYHKNILRKLYFFDSIFKHQKQKRIVYQHQTGRREILHQN